MGEEKRVCAECGSDDPRTCLRNDQSRGRPRSQRPECPFFRSPSEKRCERCEGDGAYSELAPCTTFGSDCACNGPSVIVDPCPDCDGTGVESTRNGLRRGHLADLEVVEAILLSDPRDRASDFDASPRDMAEAVRAIIDNPDLHNPDSATATSP